MHDDLAILTRTCQAFKELALDVLWEELDTVSPLAQCLPEASRSVSTRKKVRIYVFVTYCPVLIPLLHKALLV